jgi:hypothetical protein
VPLKPYSVNPSLVLAVAPSTMARNRTRFKSKVKEQEYWKKLENIGLIWLADAETDDDELEALTVLLMARRERRQAQSGRWGPRGAYNAPRVEEFFDTLLYTFSPRRFQRWLRCVAEL